MGPRSNAHLDCVVRLRLLRGAASRRQRRARLVRVSLAAILLLGGNSFVRAKFAAPFSQPKTPHLVASSTVQQKIWVVEENASRTLYSNGLMVRREHETESVPRHYRAYGRDTLARTEERHLPVGIVFHTTESLILPLEPTQNSGLVRSGQDVLAHAQRGRLYNFLIDRFGQVSRVVPERQTAYHAGHSIWASGDSVWVDLNESFLGVSFEAESAAVFVPSPAQVHSGRLLTDVLRSQFGIAEANCITHAQVSVNPDNLRIGYHTDWGSAFPFAAMGLPDNYRLPVAAVSVFGFRHDDAFLHAIQDKPWAGLLEADAEIAARAARTGLSAIEFSTQLQQLYKTLRRQRNG